MTASPPPPSPGQIKLLVPFFTALPSGGAIALLPLSGCLDWLFRISLNSTLVSGAADVQLPLCDVSGNNC